MSYPNNVLSLGTGPARHLPCGADDAYLEDLDHGGPPEQPDAHVRAYYVQKIQAIETDYGDYDGSCLTSRYTGFSVAELYEELWETMEYYHSGKYAWECGYPGNAHLPFGGDE